MRILGLIPARGGSKGIPGKNIKLLRGKPLLEYTCNSVKKSKLLTQTVLSTEDPEIIAVAEKLGIEVPFVRPSELSEDASPTIGVVKHALEYFRERDIYFDAVCLLQLTTPFREDGLIDKAVQKFRDQDLDALVSVLKVPHEYNPHWTFKTDDSDRLVIATGEKDIISRRQELPAAYHRDGAIYITRSEIVLEQNSLYGSKLGYIESSPEKYINLDTMNDWKRAEALISKYRL
ncbi:acylneuraminate cytidylyltransferase family protein [Leptobacterium flavescens]|uniref:Acylneuraminate cytidylyltransferase family protein n=1 Tax=Leptobacterium flavescens TaxID=472055 RepID=A0A6P0UP96_9FLAO|nr:acylneuraminate cytidylyltransferase family protein [Leptobacterium flavescens]NER12176.1 acylneuraminate cytidylyltransferase family protein [Leptobacterium flavescens]